MGFRETSGHNGNGKYFRVPLASDYAAIMRIRLASYGEASLSAFICVCVYIYIYIHIFLGCQSGFWKRDSQPDATGRTLNGDV